MPTTVVLAARRIHTMDPARPIATHVAIRDGRILGVGTLDSLRGWGPFELDDRHADRVLLPGFVEGHSHTAEGSYWRHVYCGFLDRTDPEGRIWPGASTVEAVLERLRVAQQALPDSQSPLFGWGLDPIYFGGARLTRHELDRVSTDRPIGIIHASGHITLANTAALRAAGLLRTDHDHPGIPLGPDRLPVGELRGPDAMMPVLLALGVDRGLFSADATGLKAFARLAVRSGTTTATDLAAVLSDEALAALQAVTDAPDFPLRLVPAMHARGDRPEAVIERAVRLKARSSERLRLGRVKVHADGSIQGFTARLRWPGYYNGAPKGLWYVEPETLQSLYRLGLQQGIQIHTHANGDEAIDLVIATLTAALREQPGADHRFMVQHAQLASHDQLRQLKALGLGVNFFANHHYYWGDAHHGLTLGPDRAERMNPCRSALDLGLLMSIHSDAPVTPLGPLHVAWCAVNRLTASGRLLGAHERISVHEALEAVTLGAARSLHLDREIGTIECGKRADFAVLEDDPFELPPASLRQTRVWGTVLGGRMQAAQTT